MRFKKILLISLLVIISLIVGMCALGVKKHRSAMKVAYIFALETAFNLKDYIKRNSECPAIPPKWTNVEKDHDDRPYVTKGAVGGWFRVIYSCNADLTYQVAVYYSMDSDTVFTGSPGSDVRISYGHFTDRKEVFVGDRGQIETVVNGLYGAE